MALPCLLTLLGPGICCYQYTKRYNFSTRLQNNFRVFCAYLCNVIELRNVVFQSVSTHAWRFDEWIRPRGTCTEQQANACVRTHPSTVMSKRAQKKWLWIGASTPGCTSVPYLQATTISKSPPQQWTNGCIRWTPERTFHWTCVLRRCARCQLISRPSRRTVHGKIVAMYVSQHCQCSNNIAAYLLTPSRWNFQ